MSNSALTQLHDVLAFSQEQLKKCQGAYRGFKAFRNNRHGLAFSATQLLQAAEALRDYAVELASISENLHDTYSDMPQQLELDDIGMKDRA